MSTITTDAGRAGHAGVHHAPVADTTTPPTADRSAATRRALRVTPAGLWVLVALLVAATLALGATRGREWYDARRTQQANAAAVAAARQLAVNFVTVDHATVDADIARVEDGATGDFLKSYSTSVEELKKVLVANKTVSTVQRTEAALVSGDLDSAVALVGVVAPTTNTAVPRGETKTYRMRLHLQKVGEEWKVGNLEFVG
jgi:Mce-associated membrane protein